ncbi:MAG: hypothetical protein J7518_10670 [Nocardioidaceae bacterium]|nr:hypothetical protein [Nocardioidaceae bacterium]
MRLKSVLSALGIAVAIVLALDYASFAATGKSAILGKLNKANRVTTFQRTNAGPAVGFNTLANQPPFSVNRTTKVARLNADLLDGKDSSAFAANNQTKVYKFTAATPATGHTFNIPIPGPGTYLLSYSVPMTLGGSTTQSEWGYCEVGQSNAIIFGTYQGSGHASTASAVGTGPSAGPTMGVSATTVINPSGFGVTFNVFCNASANWTTPPTVSFLGTTLAQPAIVTLTKLSNVTSTSTSARQPTAQQRQAMEGRMAAVR